jgi:uncharacterized protein (TIGR03118 family)
LNASADACVYAAGDGVSITVNGGGIVRSRPALRAAIVGVAALTAGALALFLGAPADAATGQKVKVVNLVADRAGAAPLADPLLKNPWGLALSPTGPLWVADNGSGYATVYGDGVGNHNATKLPLEVWVDGGSPTGQVFNDSTGFIIPPKGPRAAGKAVFLFASESGNITAWSPQVAPKNAVIVAQVPGAVYKGLAILHFGSTALLLAADFKSGRIDVFDAWFRHVPQYSRFFTDPKLPKGYAPFNVSAAPDGRGVYVSYAKQDPASPDEVAGPGLGFVDFFPGLRNMPQRIASHGTLNAPWGLAIAPASWGRLAGALLVGNFGDGRIGAYRGNKFLGLLRDGHGPIHIDGLWALTPGTANSGGTDAVWFSAGPNGEANGLVGKLVLA